MNRLNFKTFQLVMLGALPVVFMIVSAKAQDTLKRGKIKTIRIINGDTTITEKDIPGWNEGDKAEFEKRMEELHKEMGELQFRIEKEVAGGPDGIRTKIIIRDQEGLEEGDAMIFEDEDMHMSPDGKECIIIKKCMPGDSLRRRHMMIEDEHGLMHIPAPPSVPGVPPAPPIPDVEKLLEEHGLKDFKGMDGEVFIYHTKPADGKYKKMVIRVMEPGKAELKRIDPFERKTGKNNLEIEELKVYPNPSTGQFNLAFTTKEKGDAVIRIMDVNGKEIYTETLPAFTGTYHHEFDLKENASGIYFISVEQNDKKILKKVVKDE